MVRYYQLHSGTNAVAMTLRRSKGQGMLGHKLYFVRSADRIQTRKSSKISVPEGGASLPKSLSILLSPYPTNWNSKRYHISNFVLKGSLTPI